MPDLELKRLLSFLESRSGSDLSVPARLMLVCPEALAVNGAGLSIMSGSVMTMLAASDPIAEQLEHAQCAIGEGPWFDALRTNTAVLEADLTSRIAQDRWPKFAEAALTYGAIAVFGFPLCVDGVPFGALDLYSVARGPLSESDVGDALLIADLAAIAVRHQLAAGTGIFGPGTTIEESWSYPAVVHQATGMTSAQLGIGVDVALVRLRAHAFSTGRQTAEVAEDIVARRFRLEPWTAADHD